MIILSDSAQQMLDRVNEYFNSHQGYIQSMCNSSTVLLSTKRLTGTPYATHPYHMQPCTARSSLGNFRILHTALRHNISTNSIRLLSILARNASRECFGRSHTNTYRTRAVGRVFRNHDTFILRSVHIVAIGHVRDFVQTST